MKIAFLGDIALIGKYDITKNAYVKDRLKSLAMQLAEYDYVIGNLESPLTDEGKTMVCKSMHLKSPTVNVGLLKYLHIDAVSLANNHSYDYGRKGLIETIRTLDNSGICWFGVNGVNLVKEINGEKISISGFACYSTNGSGYSSDSNVEGINPLTYDNVMLQLDIDRDNEAFSIMSFHWGEEHTNYPSFEHICLAKKITKHKDVVICGHHPHIVQGVKKEDNSIIAYSLGNFLFDDCVSIAGGLSLKQNLNNKKTFILEVELANGSIIDQRCQGVRDEEHGLILFDIQGELNDISGPFEKIDSIEKYEKKRRSQINKVRQEKFGRRDFKWLKSRLNYYSVGAFIATKLRRKKYIAESKKFLGDS